MKTNDKTNPQAANQQEGPNNQNGPTYGPLTEKEYLRAIKQEAEEKLAAIFDNYMAAKSALPPEPSAKQSDFAFACWLQANHRAAYEYEQRSLCNEVRQKHQREVIEPLFQQWAASEEGREIGGKRLDWERQRRAIEADYKAATAPHVAAIEEARKRWDEIARIEQRNEANERKKQKRLTELRADIGFELCRNIKPEHADFDHATFDRYMAWDGWDYSFDGEKNAIITGPPRLGKTRAMAQKAMSLVGPDEDDYNKIEWISAAKFADLVTALGNNEERESARRRLRRLAEAHILFFDDLGAVHFTGPRISHFMTLVDARYIEGWPTHFTTNFSLRQIREMLSGQGGDTDVMVADRIIGRIIGTEAEPRAEVFEFKRRRKTSKHG
jgi:DNA replication protein DnaC